MNKVAWLAQILAAFAFLAAGALKLTSTPAEFRADPKMGWSADYTDGQIKAIGVAEVAGGIGMIAPAATGIVPLLTPVAGVSLAALMAGATMVHAERSEPVTTPLVLAALALLAAALRWRQLRAAKAKV